MEFTLIQKICILIPPILLAIIVHEVSHGWVALMCGDQTARLSGRLTLNPLPHIDPVGTVILPILMLTVSNFVFGWAKPVPVDPRNMRHPRRDMAIVAAAGPFSNLVMAVMWAGFNKVVLNIDSSAGDALIYMGHYGILINLVLGVLNCIPIPPLDGGRVLVNMLPHRIALQVSRIEPFGFIILVILMFSGVLSWIISPIIELLASWIMALFGLM